jgi:exodeoxyribonuclease III
MARKGAYGPQLACQLGAFFLANPRLSVVTLLMPTIRLATWNINSVRLRLPLLARMAEEQKPDIVCLQETKVEDTKFPLKDIQKLGFEHVAINGQKGYHGVAILSRHPFAEIEKIGFCNKSDARHLCVKIGTTELHNFYVPAGGDIPDREQNDKFGHKLDFLTEMAERLAKGKKSKSRPAMILVGDLNVAPLEHDVWSHKQLLDVVSHTPIEIDHLDQVYKSQDWVDVSRRATPEPEKLYTWWSYRAADWQASNRGRRLDHIWVTPSMEKALGKTWIVTPMRGWDRASDHVPVMTELEV